MDSSTTLTGARMGGPSTNLDRGQRGHQSQVLIGDLVLVKLDEHIRRPLLVSSVHQINVAPPMQEARLETRISGTLFCEPEDHSTPAIRSLGQGTPDPARITGRPDRHQTGCYAEHLKEGMGLGEWVTRPTNLPAGG